MCVQKPPHDYSHQLYEKYKEAFDEYITYTVRISSSYMLVFNFRLHSMTTNNSKKFIFKFHQHASIFLPWDWKETVADRLYCLSRFWFPLSLSGFYLVLFLRISLTKMVFLMKEWNELGTICLI